MSEWKEVKLQDVTSILGDGLHGTPEYTDNGEYYFINGNNLNEGNIVINNDTKRVSYTEYLKYKKELNDRTLLVSINGTLGNVAYYKGEKVVLGKSACYFNLINDIDKRFVKYIISSNYFNKYINLYATGTTIQNVSLKTMREFSFKLPELKEQKRIADVLSCLDAKIENLRRQNETLEKIAQTLFKHWFIDFEFPNADGKPYKSSGGVMVASELGDIPEGWRVVYLDEYVKVINGYSYKGVELAESDTALINLKNFDRKGGFKVDGFKSLNTNNYKTQHIAYPDDLIVAHTDLTQNAEVLGNAALVQPSEKYNKYILSMDLVKLESKKDFLNNFFFYYLLSTREFKGHCVGYSNGTTVLHLSKKAIPEYTFSMPNEIDIITTFQNIVSVTRKKITNNTTQIQTLTKIRDSLLPKLMSGKIRVEE